MSLLDDPRVREFLRRAWQDSMPGTDMAHEEGGFILRQANGSLTAERWPGGLQNQIRVPPHEGGQVNNSAIVATFHTHPNTGPEFQQEPSLTDRRALRSDTDLHHSWYEGEYVISSKILYLILQDGTVEEVGETEALLEIPPTGV